MISPLAYTLNVDDYLGKCGMDDDTFQDFQTITNDKENVPSKHNTTFPLLRTINDAIDKALNESKMNIMQEQHYFKF